MAAARSRAAPRPIDGIGWAAGAAIHSLSVVTYVRRLALQRSNRKRGAGHWIDERDRCVRLVSVSLDCGSSIHSESVSVDRSGALELLEHR